MQSKPSTHCFNFRPIAILACLRIRMLALHSSHSFGYNFTQRIHALRPAGQLSAVQNRSRRFCRSRAAPTNTNPSPSPAILVRNTGSYGFLSLVSICDTYQIRVIAGAKTAPCCNCLTVIITNTINSSDLKSI